MTGPTLFRPRSPPDSRTPDRRSGAAGPELGELHWGTIPKDLDDLDISYAHYLHRSAYSP
jgi:hypothetical protein